MTSEERARAFVEMTNKAAKAWKMGMVYEAAAALSHAMSAVSNFSESEARSNAIRALNVALDAIGKLKDHIEAEEGLDIAKKEDAE